MSRYLCGILLLVGVINNVSLGEHKSSSLLSDIETCRSSEFIDQAKLLYQKFEGKQLREFSLKCADLGDYKSIWYVLLADFGELGTKRYFFKNQKLKLEKRIFKRLDYLIIQDYQPVGYFIISLHQDKTKNEHSLSERIRQGSIYKCLSVWSLDELLKMGDMSSKIGEYKACKYRM